jgi:hypothetical protein
MLAIARRALVLLALLVGLLLLAAAPARGEATADPPISTFVERLAVGDDWQGTEFATDIAFGDVDGDGRDEVAIVSNAVTGPRVILLDDAAAGYAPLTTFGESWGPGSYATSVAFGNVDGDAADEIGLTRATSINERAILLDDAATGFAVLETWGAEWPAAVHAIAIAFGDTDADGTDEIVVAHNDISGPRAFAYDDAAAAFAPLWDAGEDWGVWAVATAVALGDTDGDGAAEVGVTRRHNSNARIFLYAGDDGAQLWATGNTWGAGAWATDIAFGNVDDDAADEIGVTRHNSVNERGYVFDDAAAGFTILARFGESWNTSAHGTSIAFGDVDGDGRDELALARETTINPRVFVYDDALGDGPFGEIWAAGGRWPGEEYATVVAFGQTDDGAMADLGVGRRTDEGARAWVFAPGWSARLPFVVGAPVEE